MESAHRVYESAYMCACVIHVAWKNHAGCVHDMGVPFYSRRNSFVCVCVTGQKN